MFEAFVVQQTYQTYTNVLQHWAELPHVAMQACLCNIEDIGCDSRYTLCPSHPTSASNPKQRLICTATSSRVLREATIGIAVGCSHESSQVLDKRTPTVFYLCSRCCPNSTFNISRSSAARLNLLFEVVSSNTVIPHPTERDEAHS